MSVFAADLDGDGKPDLAVANSGSNNVSALKNNGDGTFAAAVNYATGNYSNSVFATDLDGNTSPDLAVANFSSNNVSILLNCTAFCNCPHQGDSRRTVSSTSPMSSK